MLQRLIRPLTFFAIALFTAAGCSGSPTVPDKRLTPAQIQLQNTPLSQAQALEREGNFQQAGDLYLVTARKLSPPNSELWRAKAAEMYWKAGKLDEAEKVILSTDQTTLNTNDRAQLIVISARIARQKGQHKRVVSLLDFPTAMLPSTLQKQIIALQYQSQVKLGDKTAVANALIRRLNLAYSRTDSEKLWGILTAMPPAELAAWTKRAQDNTTRGWIDLATLSKTTGYNPEALETAILRWEQSYRNHPASPERVEAIRAQRQNLAINTQSVGVILPMTGAYSEVSSAVLDGIMAAQLGGNNQDVSIQVYDSGNDASQISSLYQRAISEGANLIIGPINKDSVDALTAQSLPVPVIALNYGKNVGAHNPNLFQFALLPEDEAGLAAERMFQDGHSNAVLFIPQGDWGDRVTMAFQSQFETFGGTITSVGRFDPKKTDISPTIKKALGVTEEGHREDVDAIFIAATPKQGRLLKPLFRFHRSGDLPVYATSHVFSGRVNASTDGDLNGIRFTEMPWLLGINNEQSMGTPKPTELDGASRQIPRLFAFGFDSFRIAPKVRELAASPLLKVNGLSGSIYADETNHLHRNMPWAKFSRGKPVALSQ